MSIAECFYKVPTCPKGYLAIAVPFGRLGKKLIVLDGEVIRPVKNEVRDRRLIAIYNARVYLTRRWEYRKERADDALRHCAFLRGPDKPYWISRTLKSSNHVKRLDGLYDGPVRLKDAERKTMA